MHSCHFSLSSETIATRKSGSYLQNLKQLLAQLHSKEDKCAGLSEREILSRWGRRAIIYGNVHHRDELFEGPVMVRPFASARKSFSTLVVQAARLGVNQHQPNGPVDARNRCIEAVTVSSQTGHVYDQNHDRTEDSVGKFRVVQLRAQTSWR